MTTLQRALEALKRCSFPELLKAEADALIAVINHYEEIMQVEVVVHGLTQDGEIYAFSTDKPDAPHVQLIIKPKPLP